MAWDLLYRERSEISLTELKHINTSRLNSEHTATLSLSDLGTETVIAAGDVRNLQDSNYYLQHLH